ncbi:MAG: dTDP-4-dehydrorhamnose 3,5-epimerase [Gammaproteobacteria bacterium]|nr:dTDP-4-dehydrorhamnose 3,5-epimerase [Gammaproteobacteria bacterium]
MQAERLAISDLVMFTPRVFTDARGFFFESFHQQHFTEATGVSPEFVQDNHSRSVKGVLRGLHYQLPPMAQGKLVRVIQGEIYDVAVDLRRASPTFGRWAGALLSADNRRQLWIPEGFAHGFITLSDSSEVLYKATRYYAPELERCIAWDDTDLAIDWQYPGAPELSAKDRQGAPFREAELL